MEQLEDKNISMELPVRYWRILLALGQFADPVGIFGLKQFCLDKTNELQQKMVEDNADVGHNRQKSS